MITTPRCFYAEIDKESGDYLLLMEDMSKCRAGDLSGKLEDVAIEYSLDQCWDNIRRGL